MTSGSRSNQYIDALKIRTKIKDLVHFTFQPLPCEYELYPFITSSHIFLLKSDCSTERCLGSLPTKNGKWATRDLKAISSKSVITEVHLSGQIPIKDFFLVRDIMSR